MNERESDQKVEVSVSGSAVYRGVANYLKNTLGLASKIDSMVDKLVLDEVTKRISKIDQEIQNIIQAEVSRLLRDRVAFEVKRLASEAVVTEVKTRVKEILKKGEW